MKKIILIIIAVIVLLAVAITLFYFSYDTITGQAIAEENYSTYTKAVCDETNFCQDNVISCRNGEVESVSPLTGAFIQHDEEWQDPRGKNGSEILCS